MSQPAAPPPTNPIRPTDDEARALARSLITPARFGALGTLDPETGFPQVTRIALGQDPEDGIVTFVSGLSAHTRALRRDPRAGLLIGEPGDKGDPLTHPRLSLQIEAQPILRDDPRFAGLQTTWLADHPKARLYIDLPDFIFFALRPLSAALNAGFGRAYTLTPSDLK